MQKKFPVPPILILSSLIVGIWIGYSLSGRFLGGVGIDDDAIKNIRQGSGYTFINPLLECETNTLGNNQKYIPFEKEITKKIQGIQDTHPDIHIAVYFRNLRNGPWFGVDENSEYSPASLMKLPILIAYLKWSEDAPDILSTKITPTENNQLSQEYAPESKILVGTPYTVIDLLYHLIAYSDNTASNTLLGKIPESVLARVYGDLGIPSPKTADYTLTVKEYASFFRILYNASYLSRNLSEAALRLLSQSTFTGGLSGKLPPGILVAHKFGEREILEEGKRINQLHDCGIIYYEKYPYLLCVMTRGETEMGNLSEIIQNISKLVYDEISAKYP